MACMYDNCLGREPLAIAASAGGGARTISTAAERRRWPYENNYSIPNVRGIYNGEEECMASAACMAAA